MNTYFNTAQFTEVFGGVHAGTTQFSDTHNPGVLYTSTSKGIVRRVIKTKEIVVNRITGKRTVTYVKQGYVINPRINGKYIPLITLNARLQRIQQQAEKFNKKRFILDECRSIETPEGFKVILVSS